MKLNAAILIKAVGGTGLVIPKGGWRAASFARHGRAMILALHRTAQLAQRRGARTLAKATLAHFKAVLSLTIELAEEAFRSRSQASARSGSGKASLVIGIAAAEEVWFAAIDEALRRLAPEVNAELVPTIQSVLGQGYSRTALLMGQATASEDFNQGLAQRARGIAEKITRIDDTTRTRFDNAVRSAIGENLTVQETAAMLRDRVGGINQRRSLLIARTEMNNAWTQGSVQSLKESRSITHVSVIGCKAREANSPKYRGESTCNIQDVPIADADKLEFHINHTGTVIPSGFIE